jgi:hypothetical protein
MDARPNDLLFSPQGNFQIGQCKGKMDFQRQLTSKLYPLFSENIIKHFGIEFGSHKHVCLWDIDSHRLRKEL